MRTTSTINNRVSVVNSNKAIYAVYGMDEKGSNCIHEMSEFDNFEEALNAYNAIRVNQEEGEQKSLRLQIVNEHDEVILEDYLLEV